MNALYTLYSYALLWDKSHFTGEKTVAERVVSNMPKDTQLVDCRARARYWTCLFVCLLVLLQSFILITNFPTPTIKKKIMQVYTSNGRTEFLYPVLSMIDLILHR